MSSPLRKLNKSDRHRQVFRRSRPKRVTPLWRQPIESLLMLISGIGLLAFLNWVPQQEELDGMVIVSEAISNLILGITNLLKAILGFGSVILMAVLVMLGLTLLLGGSWRMLKFFAHLWSRTKRPSQRGIRHQIRR
ncbi:MAG: hypothetical protein AB8A49_01215 [Prochlorococcus sp.]|jgi:O-antigen/teichoic acid export membrane protein|nr:hypothetical protein [Prochlorococcaceae cyanobacterium ETNP14_MAG_5]MDP6851812.1 hypothetical protein [Prochlorococcaceae cyanobacterium ETNP1_MAG_8]